MGKAPNGHGSVRKITKGRHKGKWRVAVVVGKTADGRLIRKTGIYAKQADAEAQRAILVAQRGAGRFGSASRRTLSDQLNLWLDTIRPDITEGTHYHYSWAVNTHVVPHLGALPLSKVDVPAIEAWLVALDDAEVGGRSRQAAYNVLSAALTHAVNRGDLGINLCDRVRKPSSKRKKVEPFTADEADLILAETFETRYAALFRLALSTGMRQGELFGLRPHRDIDLTAGTVSITRQVVESAGRIIVQPYPKTDSSNRTLHLSDAAIVLVMEHRKWMLKEGHAGREFEFVAREGGVIRRSLFRARVWVPLLERIEVRHRGAHHLRHTFATLMLGAKVPLHVVSKMLGHARPSITADLYAHAIPDQIEEATTAVRRLFG
jgi:integrase